MLERITLPRVIERQPPHGHTLPPDIARMRELRKAGLGFDRIARALNTEGVKPRTGTRWHGMVANRILSC